MLTRRYAILTNKFFYTFTSNDANAECTSDMALDSVLLVEDLHGKEKGENCFSITGNTEIICCADSYQECADWVEALDRVVEEIKARKILGDFKLKLQFKL